MPWIKRMPKPHSCKRPNIEMAFWRIPRVGDQWQCRKCRRIWEVRDGGVYSNVTWGSVRNG